MGTWRLPGKWLQHLLGPIFLAHIATLGDRAPRIETQLMKETLKVWEIENKVQ